MLAFANPFVVSDPNDGVESYEISFPAIPHTEIIIAETDGSMKYDLQNWIHGQGWFYGEVKAQSNYEFVDDATGITTTVLNQSDPAMFQLKIPNTKSSSGHRLEEF
jgi:hypothetical protein